MALFDLPLTNDVSRRILHVDMDAFYASIEQRDNPALRKRALVISHDPRETGGKGVVTTANYVARQYGVHSAMPANQALKLVPKSLLVFQPPDFAKYKAVSQQVHELFNQLTPLVESVALDEAYLDVTDNERFASKVTLAMWLQRRIFEETQLTSSIGLSYNKFLAKEASEYNKPNGRTVVLPEQAQAFLDRLPIEAFRGVGQKTLPKLQALGVSNGKSLRALTQEQLIATLGKAGFGLYQHARGVDLRPVAVRDAKSIGKERTFRAVLTSQAGVRQALSELAMQVAASLARKQKHGKTVVLKVRDAEFVTQTKRVTEERYVSDAEKILTLAWQLWQALPVQPASVRLLGITVTGLEPKQFENLDLPL